MCTTYHVLFIDEQVCAELMTVGWMTPFVDPAIRALAMLEALAAAAQIPARKFRSRPMPRPAGR